jgi:hypothetical protein
MPLYKPARMRLAPSGLGVGSNLQSGDYRLQIFSVYLDGREFARNPWFDRRAAQSIESSDPGVRKGRSARYLLPCGA